MVNPCHLCIWRLQLARTWSVQAGEKSQTFLFLGIFELIRQVKMPDMCTSKDITVVWSQSAITVVPYNQFYTGRWSKPGSFVHGGAQHSNPGFSTSVLLWKDTTIRKETLVVHSQGWVPMGWYNYCLPKISVFYVPRWDQISSNCTR